MKKSSETEGKVQKSIYRQCREEAGMTREEASEAMRYISPSQIEKYEKGKTSLGPEEVMTMAKVYHRPDLCNYYCSHECPIGKEYVPEVRPRNLAQIVLQTIATLNDLNRAKDRFIEITADGQISEDEMTDFVRIENGIREIGMAADSLSLWMEKTIETGKIDKEKLDKARAAIRKENERSTGTQDGQADGKQGKA